MKYNLIKIFGIIVLSVIFNLGCRKKNQPPYAPYTPTGPTIGIIDSTYHFQTLAIDPDGDSVAIMVNWGSTAEYDTSYDFISQWVASGESVSMSRSWQEPGTYRIKAKAMDYTELLESEWSLPHYFEIKESFYTVLWICQTNSAEWSSREGHASVVFNNKLWVLGGFDGNQNFEVWNSTDGFNWICVNDSVHFLGDGTKAVVFDNKIWVLGGTEDGGLPRNHVWCSSDGVNWTMVTNSAGWSSRAEHTVAVFDNKMWVIGGTGSQTGNDVWYSTDGENWICATNSAEWAPRTEPTAVVYDNKIWIMGGESEDFGFSDVWYSSNGSEWFQATLSAAWQGRHDHSAVVFDNKMWVLGGMVDSVGEPNASNDVWYSTDGHTWICDTALTKFTRRSGHTAVVFDNKIWVVGGAWDDFSLKNDVWYRVVIEEK
jgi:hypothetical protein